MDLGFWSLLPMIVALVFAFATRSALFSLLGGVVVGAFMIGGNPAVELNTVFQNSLATAEFIWVCEIVIFIGIITELFKRSGVISAFAAKLSGFGRSPRSVKVISWMMGLFIIDDYFSPLITGTIMRPLSDQARISREKLAFILDSTTASVCALVPFLSWGAYLVSLIVAQGGPVSTPGQGMEIFIRAIPYNFYSILLVLFTLGISLQLIPDFGPMRKAEKRARDQGLVLREGAVPLLDDTQGDLGEARSGKTHLVAHMLIPIIIVLATAVGGYIFSDRILIAEAFMISMTYLVVAMIISRQIRSVDELTHITMSGIKSVLPALLIVALAYSLNAVTNSLGAADWLIEVSKGLMSPGTLVAMTFLLAAIISFATGTSWGAFALMIPLALPLAYSFTGGEVDPLIYKTVAAITGGGIFGDHASPLSDTSVLASAGAGSDHMDHVITQIPYAVSIAAVTLLLYFVV